MFYIAFLSKHFGYILTSRSLQHNVVVFTSMQMHLVIIGHLAEIILLVKCNNSFIFIESVKLWMHEAGC